MTSCKEDTDTPLTLFLIRFFIAGLAEAYNAGRRGF
jgi:cbb3-type cytochrome oxidase subunit 3